MRIASAAIQGIATSTAFRASAAPYLLLDADLRIRAANLAYQQATHHDSVDMVSEFMFDVFPDNPATPDAQSVERLMASFERVLLTGKPDRMGTQRYDVIDGGHGFVQSAGSLSTLRSETPTVRQLAFCITSRTSPACSSAPHSNATFMRQTHLTLATPRSPAAPRLTTCEATCAKGGPEPRC